MNIYTNNYRRNLILYWRQYFPQWDIPKGYHVHHIVPVSCGGSHHPKNLIALHPDDHATIHRCRGDKSVGGVILVAGQKRFGKDNPFYGKKHTEETKKLMSEKKRGTLPWNTGKTRPPFTEEWIENIRKANIGELNNFYGKTHSDEQKAKWRISRCKEITVKGITFKSRLAAAEYYNVSPTTISNWKKKELNQSQPSNAL